MTNYHVFGEDGCDVPRFTEDFLSEEVVKELQK
jgi:hypothetical protein